jgi:predicted CDP-diglyceride synthetase/phosphatidate cytidylyltransferase
MGNGITVRWQKHLECRFTYYLLPITYYLLPITYYQKAFFFVPHQYANGILAILITNLVSFYGFSASPNYKLLSN